jgi:FkbM family methyltransferase
VRELERFDSCVLSPAYPHPHPSTYRLAEFVSRIQPRRVGNPFVVLVLRDDRRWGRTARAQARHAGELARRLRRRFPDVGVVAIGVGGRTALPASVEDLRARKPTVDDERAWLELLRGADLVVGVHGSHMLLPSGLARGTIELQPRFRIDHVFQATLLDERDPLEALVNHRILYGDDRLADVSPARVAELAASMLMERERFAALMLGAAAGRTDGSVPLVRSSADDHRPWLQRSAAEALGRVRRARTAGRLARGRAAAALARVRARRHRPPLALPDRRGLRFELERRDEVDQFLLHGGHFERAEIDFLAAYLRRGDIAFDVGANVGFFTAPMARAVAPGGVVHAFEPFPSSATRLDRNLRLNGIDNVVVNRSAVADRPGGLSLTDYGPGYESWASAVRGSIEHAGTTVAPAGTLEVEAISLDEYCSRQGVHRIAALKIDVEGGEASVLAGARRLLAEGAVELALVEVSDNTLPAGTSSHELVSLLEDHGLRPHVLSGGTLVPFRPVGHVDFANVVAVSAAASSRARAAQSRAKA